MRRFALRWVALLACCVLLLPACGDSGDDTAEATVAPTTEATSTTAVPTTTAQSSTSTTVTAGAGLPGPGEPWDVLFIGYDHALTRLPGELYAGHAADVLDAEVRWSRTPDDESFTWAEMTHVVFRDDGLRAFGFADRDSWSPAVWEGVAGGTDSDNTD